MKPIKNFLPNLSFTESNKNKHWKFKLMHEWKSIVGNLYSKVSIYKIYNNSIILGVSDISWMQELYMLSEIIKQKINNSLDESRIEIIRFKYIAKKTINKKIEDTSSCKELDQKKLTPKEQAALQKISDPELYKALTRLLNKCH